MKKNLSHRFDVRRLAVFLLSTLMIWNSIVYCQSSNLSDIVPNDNVFRRIVVKTALNPPEGFDLKVQPRFYGTPENRLEEGTIFDYINGAGDNYIKHGFTSVAHIIFDNSAGDRITVDVYDLSSIQNTQDAFEDKNICAPGSFPLDLGIRLQAKIYSYPPDYMLYFVENRFFVHINLDNDAFKDTVEVLSAQIIRLINGE